MKEGMPLDKIYTAVKFLRDSDLKYFSTLDNLEELYRQAGNRRFRVGKSERQEGLTAANNEQYLMVLGGPGVGKSTFLRKLGLEALEKRLAHDVVPVFIELKSFRSEEMSLQQAIAKELKISGFSYAESLVESMLSKGKMLILLDGLDEVPSKQVDSVIEQIRDLCDQHNQNRFVTSCRVAAYKGGFTRFTDVTIAEFDNEQIQQFVQRWFSSELDVQSSTAQKFWELINQSENASAKELAQTPLLLTFLCLVYDRSQSLPPVRSDLYGKALNILLEDWAAEKRIERDPIYQGLHTGLEKVLLSKIAYQSFKDDQLFFSEEGITDRITDFLADTLYAPKYLDGAAVLNAIEVQQGILLERATNAYSFSHLTLQEYLTARYIRNNHLIQELVSEHLTDERWREVFILTSGLLEERSQELWLLMEQQSNKFTREPKLQNLLQWAKNLSATSKPDKRLLAQRALLLVSAVNIASTLSSDRNIKQTNSKTSDIASDIINTGTIISVGRFSRRFCVGTIFRKNYLAPAIDIAHAINIDIDKVNFIGVDRFNDVFRAINKGSSLSIRLPSTGSSKVFNQKAIFTNILSIFQKARDFFATAEKARVFCTAIGIDIDYNRLARNLENLKGQIPSNMCIHYEDAESAPGKWQKVTNQLIEAYLTFFHLDKELVTFSLEEAQALEKYLYAVKLIIDCKNAAVRVSRKEWEAIEVRLLTPQGEVGAEDA
ncbi:MAG: NACHT domain-containing protein [Cyanobacteria bacterium P01_H01_bin.58]